ncbi:hypothetical protein LguiA_033654 [Lonicera macranthoides]
MGTHHRSSVPTNWPLVGMMPGLLENAHCVHEFMTDLLKETGGTFMLKGHWIDKNTKTVLCFYSMGRMGTIWGKDCLEFMAERWISESGGIKLERSFNFPAFNAGPRSCLGKDMALQEMEIIATTIIYNYRVEVVEGHPITPSDQLCFK